MKSEPVLPNRLSRFQRIKILSPSETGVGAAPACDVYDKHVRVEYLLMCGLGLIVFAVYCYTLCPGVYPGTSAVATGKVLGLLPGVPDSHPVWLSVFRAVSHLPVFIAPYRLNLFNALCASVAVALLFRIVTRVAFELIRAAPSLRFVPISDDEAETEHAQADGDAAALTVDLEDETMEHVAATLGGVVSALVFAFCAPFWLASTSLHVQPFDVLLLIISADLLARYHFTGKLGSCVAAVFLCGAGLIESPMFLFLAPLFAAVLILACIRYNQISESFLLLLLAVGFAGVAASLALFFSLSASDQVAFVPKLSQVALDYSRTYRTLLVQSVPRPDGLYVLLVPLFSLVMSVVGTRKTAFCRDEATRWKWLVINAIFSAVMVAEMLNLPRTVWNVAREGSHLPILPSLVVAVAVGLFIVFWCHMGIAPTYDAARELEQPPLVRRVIGYGMCGLLVIMGLRAANLNLDDADGRKAAFADRIAQHMLALSNPARCLVTDGTLDLNLLIHTRVQKRNLTFIPAGSSYRAKEANTCSLSTVQRLALVPPAGTRRGAPEATVEQWLRNNPAEHMQFATVGTPEFWRRAGLVPVPNGLLYIGARNTDDLDLAALMGKSLDVWQRIATLLKDDPAMLPILRRTQADVRAHVSRMANELGIHLEIAGHLADADTAYSMSLGMDDMNLCAILNRYGLRLRQPEVGPVSEATRQVLHVTEKPRFFDDFDVVIAHYGTLAPQLADILVPRVMAYYPSGVTPPPNLIKLMDKWLSLSRATSLSPPPVTINSADPLFKQAIEARVQGHGDEAERIVRKIVQNRPSNLSAWSFLADILLNRGEVEEVSDIILPTMRTLAGGVTNQLVEITQGCLHMRVEPPRYDAARVSLKNAFDLNPSVAIVSEQLLQADMCLGNASFIAADALAVVKHNPTHALANALLGGLCLVQKRLDEAESYLRTSLECRPSAGAHNNLAELFRQQKKWADAEQHARLAIRLAPGFYQAWATLVDVLADSGRTDEASVAFHCALALRSPLDPHAVACPIHPRLDKDRNEADDRQYQLAEMRLLNVPTPVSEVLSDFERKERTQPRADLMFIDKTSWSLTFKR